MKTFVVLMGAMLLFGCGSNSGNAPNGFDVALNARGYMNVDESAGRFVKTERNAVTGEWFTTTTTGIFRMYSSTRVPEDVNVTLRTVYNVSHTAKVVDRELITPYTAFAVKL